MVTKYSGRTGSVGGRTKLVLSMSPSTVKNSTSSVKVTAKFYYESKYRTQDSFNTGKLSGSLGSWSGGFSINGTSKLIKTITKTISTSYSGSKKITVTGTLQTIEASPGAHKVTASIRIPQRPVAKPRTPSNVNMSLLSDNRLKTTWSASSSSAQPITSYTVEYQRLDGSSWTGWKHSATVKGKSYTSNPGTNNHSYRRRVRSNNSAGSSGWAYSNYVRTQPYGPTNVKARVKASGDDIAVSWDFNNPAESKVFTLQLQRSVNGGSWANVVSSFGQVKSKPYTSSYTDTAPGNGTNKYRLRILNSGQADDSVWAESNTVNTIVPPKAPDHLAPDGSVVDFTQNILFTWQHHDDGDGADQSHYDLRYREAGSPDWTYVLPGGVSSETSEHLVEAYELENGVDYEWQVKTQGNTKEGFGPWSKLAFVTGWTAPVVSINEGAPPNPLTALPVPLSWTYSQDEGVSQIEWEARLYGVGSGDIFDSLLEEKSAQSASTSTEFQTVLTDGARYGVSVRARSAKGQWSEWSETRFDVELLVPAETRIDLAYDSELGQMNLHVIADDAVFDETAAVVSIDVERRINGGEWVPIMVDIPFDTETTLVDNIPSLWGVNEYRVTARTDAPSSASFGPWRKTVSPYVLNEENLLFLNWGETFDHMAKMQGDLSTSGSYDRSKETQKLLGRKKPISLLGDQLSREHSVSGVAHYFPGECAVGVVPDGEVELVGGKFFDDSSAWDYSQVVAGPDSGVTAEAHYRAKTFGYLVDVVGGNTTNLVSPSPLSGVSGTEVDALDDEVVRENLAVDPALSDTSLWSPNAVAMGLLPAPAGSTGNVHENVLAMAGPVEDTLHAESSNLASVATGDVFTLGLNVSTPPKYSVSVRIYWYNGTSFISSTEIVIPGEGYEKFNRGVVSGTAPAGTDGVKASVWVLTASGSSTVNSSAGVYMDAMTFERGTTTGTYFDGDTAPGVVQRTNLVTDPSMSDLPSWLYASGKATLQSASDAKYGDASALFTATADANAYTYQQAPLFSVPPGWTGFSGWFKNGTGTPFVRVRIEFYDADNTSLSFPDIVSSTKVGASWAKVSGALEAPAGTAYAYVYAYIYGDSTGGVAPAGSAWLTDGWMVAHGDTQTEALALVSTYFDGDTPTDEDIEYRWAGTPGASQSEEVLMGERPVSYRWTGDDGASTSEEYLPAVAEHFGEYADNLIIEGGEVYNVEAYVRAPGLTVGSRVNLTSQGALSTDRQLWGSSSLKSNGGSWSASGGTVTEGALKLSKAVQIMGNTTSASGILATHATAATVRQPDLAGRTFTVGANVSADGAEELTADKSFIRFQYFDSSGGVIQVGGSNYDAYGLSTTGGEGRMVFTVTMPAGTESFTMNVLNQNTSVGLFLDAVTFESGTTDGSWIEQDGEEERFGVENMDSVDLMVEAFDADGVSLSVDVVATLEKDEFSSRWRTISGEYSAPAEGVTARLWVEWNVNGEHSANQVDWYVGGMSAVKVYVALERWPGPDASPDEWREAQYESTTVCLRTPYGVRLFGAMSGLEVSSMDGTVDLAQVSFTVTETDYTENPLVIDESDIWDDPVLEPFGRVDPEGGMGPFGQFVGDA